MIIVEKFDYRKFDTEKVKFAIDLDGTVFNVSEGTRIEDELDNSPLWRGKYSVAEYREMLWEEIKVHFPRYLSKGLKGFYHPYLVPDSTIFRCLMQLTEAYKEKGKLKLIYISDRLHAELIARCVKYLVEQI